MNAGFGRVLHRTALLDELFLSALCRYPQEHEKSEMLKLIAETPAEEHRVLIEDITWGLISSREFIFNH